MKTVFGSMCLLILLAAAGITAAEEPGETPYLSTSNECGMSMGFIYAYRGGTLWCNYVITGSHPNGGYYSPALILPTTGTMGYGSFRIAWNSEDLRWEEHSSTSLPIDSCARQWYEDIQGLTNEERTDVPMIYDDYFGDSCRYDRTADEDGDGYLDYYDLDCERYNEYLQYCEENGIEPLDLVDYQYFQDNAIETWLAQRNTMTDTDGDGFSDGYETIHGTEVYDGSDYPLGLPDTGKSLLIVGGVDEKEPWRLEQYNDSGYSRGYIYDQGHDPFGTEALTFEDDPDWGLLDSDNDGLLNYSELANGTNPYRFEFQSGFSYVYDEEGGFYYVTGYTEDGAFGDYSDPPTEEEWLAAHDDYEIGDYAFNPSEYAFGNEKYDGLLSKTGKIKFDCDNIRPQTQRDYKLYFNLPIPGEGTQSFAVSVMPDTGTPAGAAMEIVRQLIRGMSGVILSYVFVKHVWLAIRQY